MTEKPDPDRARLLLVRWHVKCRRNRAANYLAANVFSRRHYLIGVIAVSLSTFVGTSIFVSLGRQVVPILQITVGGISVLAAVVAALQTFLKYGDRALSHRHFGARYGALVRHIEALLATSRETPSTEVFEELRMKMDTLAEEAPELPERIWRRSLKEIPAQESEWDSSAEFVRVTRPDYPASGVQPRH